MEYDNGTFAGMALANEVHLAGLVAFVKRLGAAIGAHFVSMPAGTALRDFNHQLA